MSGHFDDEFFDKSVSNFDKEFNRVFKPRAAFKAGITLWGLGVVASLGFWGAVIYVAVHFLGKYW